MIFLNFYFIFEIKIIYSEYKTDLQIQNDYNPIYKYKLF